MKDPRLLFGNPTGFVSANGKAVDLSGPVQIQGGTRSLSFHFTSESLFAPQRVHFRYSLEDAEADWTEVVGSRQVLYNNLTPGSYHFHVVASRDGASWNSPETVYAYSIERMYWQTWWFRTTCAFAILLTILFFIRLRTIRVARQLNTRFQGRRPAHISLPDCHESGWGNARSRRPVDGCFPVWSPAPQSS